MMNFKEKILIMALGGLFVVGCSSTPLKKLTPSEMLVYQSKPYVKQPTSQGLTGWEKGIWFHAHKQYVQGRKILDTYKNKPITDVLHAYGFMYQEGLGGLPKNPQKAVEYYQKAIKINNYPPSLYNLSFLYKSGQGVSKNIRKYQEVLESSAQQGYPYAQFNLADDYHWGRNGYTQDYGKAYYWYQQASNQGMAKAARRIGWMYDKGEGFERNAEKAFYWHKLATKRGNEHSRGDMIRLKSELYKKSKNR